MSTRPGGRTARVRAKVFAATIELVARHGVAGVRYEEVAELSGVHKTSVYRNWPTREALVGEALENYAAQLVPLADTGDLRADLVDFLCLLADNLASPVGRAVVRAVMDGAPDRADLRHDLMHRRLDVVRERFAHAVTAGQLPNVDAASLAEALTAPVHYRVNIGLSPFTRTDAEWITDVVLAGVRARAEPHPTER